MNILYKNCCLKHIVRNPSVLQKKKNRVLFLQLVPGMPPIL